MADFLKRLNKAAANYGWGESTPKDAPSKPQEAATKKERKNISKEYQQEPGSLSDKIRKVFGN